jgi:hypothetical protein
MPRRVLVALVAFLLPVLAGPAVVSAAVAAAAPSVAAVTATPPTDPPVVTDNDFIPQGNLSDCVSALPQPDCGSDAKGGWRQLLVLAVVVVGLAFVGWRITRTVRRNRRALESSDGR